MSLNLNGSAKVCVYTKNLLSGFKENEMKCLIFSCNYDIKRSRHNIPRCFSLFVLLFLDTIFTVI